MNGQFVCGTGAPQRSATVNTPDGRFTTMRPYLAAAYRYLIRAIVYDRITVGKPFASFDSFQCDMKYA
jgi:hypothetical protein